MAHTHTLRWSSFQVRSVRRVSLHLPMHLPMHLLLLSSGWSFAQISLPLSKRNCLHRVSSATASFAAFTGCSAEDRRHRCCLICCLYRLLCSSTVDRAFKRAPAIKIMAVRGSRGRHAALVGLPPHKNSPGAPHERNPSGTHVRHQRHDGMSDTTAR